MHPAPRRSLADIAEMETTTNKQLAQYREWAMRADYEPLRVALESVQTQREQMVEHNRTCTGCPRPPSEARELLDMITADLTDTTAHMILAVAGAFQANVTMLRDLQAKSEADDLRRVDVARAVKENAYRLGMLAKQHANILDSLGRMQMRKNGGEPNVRLNRLIEALTEWADLHAEAGKLHPLAGGLPTVKADPVSGNPVRVN